MRMIAATVISLIANAVGLIVANLLLDDMTLNASGFLIAVGVFTLTFIVIQPLIQKQAIGRRSALSGGTALVASLIALIVADVVSDGLEIEGLSTWLIAAVIVWLGAVLAAFLLPFVVFKNVRENRNDA